MNTTELAKKSEKYVKALTILQALQSNKNQSMPLYEMTPEQVYILMDNELYDWHESLELWQSIF